VHTPRDCTGGNKCVTATCDDLLGCVVTPLDPEVACDDFNECTIDTCDNATGCVNTNRTDCDDGQPCTDDYCDPIQGCLSDIKFCPDQPKCDIGIIPSCYFLVHTYTGVCNNGTCEYIHPDLCEEEILAIGLSAGAIAGIVIAAIVVASLLSFGAYKGVQAYNASKDLDAVGNENPLYEQGGTYGENKAFGNYALFAGSGPARV